MVTFRRLLTFLRPYRRAVTVSFLLAFGAMVATVLIPYLTGRAIDAMICYRRALNSNAYAVQARYRLGEVLRGMSGSE